ncbi:exonuclease 3'-5' domain-containing 2 [Cotesia typhae]|uniref:exonuclease 3'-5' domain-containing 2 n=1 Tax=Cotesia typhae TaxID=2053667 RepID=UPI003D697E1D
MILECITVGILFLATKYRDNVVSGIKNLCKINKSKSDYSDKNNNVNDNSGDNYKYNNNEALVPALSFNNIILADNPEKCDFAVERLRSDLTDGVLGFDCEWVNEGPVSLVQLATNNGTAAVFRIGKIGYVPLQLQELLSNNAIIKVGVGAYDDGRKILSSYNCVVLGTLDLRLLAERLSVTSRQSLAAMSLQYLDYEMEKLTDIRCSNWDADQLDNDQIQYAATDAIISIFVYHEIMKEADKKKSTWSKIVLFIKKNWSRNSYVLHDIPKDTIDIRYRGPSKKIKAINASPADSERPKKLNNYNIDCENSKRANIPTRKEPLYHNCYLEAPDGETLCTCDRKKAEWYIMKELGVKVKEDPLTVRLKFEPSGRALGQVGEYYTQVKLNQCVVCGAEDKFIKKNVVPREYRKYFPLVMKSHQSHDVLLLCPRCHEISNRSDLAMRQSLARMCNAPLSKPLTLRNDQYHRKRELMSAVKVLRDNNPSIPRHRRKEMESRVLEFTGYDRITPEVTDIVHQKLMSDSTSSSHQVSKPLHGLRVVEYFTKSEKGLVELERLWREHFLNTMKPKYLPKLWSVHHNQERLEIRVGQNRIEPQDAKLAGLR